MTRNGTCDVAIVGGGITGALLSQSLTASGIKPLIIERRRDALLGSTAASTSLLQFELDTPLVELTRKIGRRAAERIWRCSLESIAELRTRVRLLKIDARMRPRPSLYLAGNVLDAAGLRRELKARQRVGLPSELLERKALSRHFEISRSAAILSHGNAEADPLALAAGFLRRALREGARLHAPNEVVDLYTHRRGVTLALEHGLQIEARRVVFCTGYEMPKIVPAGANRITSTWAMATRAQPQKLWPQRALIWEASDPYLYLRTTPDGRVLCGGEDEEFTNEKRRDARIEAKTATLERKLGKLHDRLDTRAAYRWAGCFGSSPAGTPTIGQIPGHPRCYAALGYGGNGITFAMLAATLLTAQLRGTPEPHARLFAFE
ncbi:MAG: FAD-dependent oxidoreductase [Gammaproteobacteria bacterium]